MIDFILWFILIYLAFRIFAKYLFPSVLKYYLKRIQQNFNQQNEAQQPMRKEGETNVEFTPETKTKKGKNTETIGEYIDYEEMDNK